MNNKIINFFIRHTSPNRCLECQDYIAIGTDVTDINGKFYCYTCANICASTGIQNCDQQNCECE
jgi:hypothetical protein